MIVQHTGTHNTGPNHPRDVSVRGRIVKGTYRPWGAPLKGRILMFGDTSFGDELSLYRFLQSLSNHNNDTL